MLVTLYPNINKIQTNNRKTSLQPISQAPSSLTIKNSKNVSFGSGLSTTILVARGGISAINGFLKGMRRDKLVKELESVLGHPETSKNDLYTALLALIKTPYEDRMGVSEINELKIKVFKNNLLKYLDDNNPINIQLKKDYFNAYLDDPDKDCTPFEGFVSSFASLPDQHYKSFKEELIDKVFYSETYKKKAYNINTGWDTIPNEQLDEIFRYDVELVESLDKNIYSGYLRKISPKIIEHKKFIFNNLKTDRLYDLFNTNLNPLLNPEYNPPYGRGVTNWTATRMRTRSKDPYAKIFLEEVIKACEGDAEKFSKMTGLKEYLAKDIILDNVYINYLNISSKTPAEKGKLLEERCLSKLRSPHYEIARRSLAWLNEPIDINAFLKENEKRIVKLFYETDTPKKDEDHCDLDVRHIIEKLQRKYKFTSDRLFYPC